MPAPASNADVLLTPEGFLQNTKSKFVRVATAQAYKDGQTTSYQLPQAGLAYMLWVIVQGTITVAGTVTGGTIANYPNPAPYALIKRVKFGNNNSFNMRDFTGWGWYKWLRWRYGLDPLSSGATVNFSANNTAAMGLTGAGRPVAGANVAATTYNVNLMLPLPIAYNQSGELGLIVLQQNSTFYSVQIDWGQVTTGIGATGGSNDFFTGVTGTGLTVTAAITATVGLEFFEAIKGVGALVSMFMQVNEQNNGALVNGENTIRLPANDFYTAFQVEVLNNGAPVAVANIQNPTFMHSGAIYDIQDDYLVNLARNYFQHRNVPPDGTITYDFGLRRGIIDRRDTIDMFDNSNITDAVVKFTLPGSGTLTLTGLNQSSVVMESLRYIDQH